MAGRRLILQSRDGHAIWVSGRILLENQPYPDAVPGGIIVRDEAGNPTGELKPSKHQHDLVAALTLLRGLHGQRSRAHQENTFK